jgi:anti-sigma regulatory factor (Ser/Thr protein kinase)
MTGQASVGGHARHAAWPSGAPVRIPPLADSQGNDVTGRWPLRSFLELGTLPSAVPCARLHTRQLLWGWGLQTALGDSAELLVSEIATNAIQVTQADAYSAPVRLWLLADRARLLILVWDASPLPPVRVSSSADAENGRGLLLVDTISARWGWHVLPDKGDLNYSALLDFSENEFTQAGPGALRGIKKCFEDLGDYTPAEIVLWMTERQDDEFARLGLPFGGLWGRPLHAIDCQGLFCETDKYCREAAPELASARKRIKARFTPAPEPVRLFFPPKWGINDKMPSQPVLSNANPAQHEQAALF